MGLGAEGGEGTSVGFASAADCLLAGVSTGIPLVCMVGILSWLFGEVAAEGEECVGVESAIAGRSDEAPVPLDDHGGEAGVKPDGRLE